MTGWKEILKRLIGRDSRVEHLERELDRCQAQAEVHFSDLVMLIGKAGWPSSSGVAIKTDYPVALASNDHLHPRGTMNDNTRHPRFVTALREWLGDDLSYLDLGCAGGGLVFDFLINGFEAYGIEGSDYSRKHQRAFWGVIPERLFTADITKPFQLQEMAADTPKTFRVIGAWEVLEHLEEAALEGFFQNVRTHLREDGVFVASVATFKDFDPATGVHWHKTIMPKAWWVEKCATFGFEEADLPFATTDFPRGSGNPTVPDWDARANPELGFHMALKPAIP